METQEQKFTRELANSRMQIELLRNQVLLRYYAQLLELDIMQHPKEVKTLTLCSKIHPQRLGRGYSLL